MKVKGLNNLHHLDRYQKYSLKRHIESIASTLATDPDFAEIEGGRVFFYKNGPICPIGIHYEDLES